MYVGRENGNVVFSMCIFMSSVVLMRGRGIIVAQLNYELLKDMEVLLA